MVFKFRCRHRAAEKYLAAVCTEFTLINRQASENSRGSRRYATLGEPAETEFQVPPIACVTLRSKSQFQEVRPFRRFDPLELQFSPPDTV